MAHPIGMPSTEVSPDVWVGTTPQGIQRALGSMYMNSGVVPGAGSGGRSRGTSSWAYDVPALTYFMWRSSTSRTGILIPVEETMVSVSSTGGAARTDAIYLRDDGIVRVREGSSSAPSGGVILDIMEIPAGASNTAQAVSANDRRYAIPAGASMGRLASWEIPGQTRIDSEARVDLYTARFVVPTDRVIRVDLTTTLRSLNQGAAHLGLGISVDGTFRRALSCNIHDWWTSYSGTWTTEVNEGAHTITVWANLNGGAGGVTAAGATTTQMNLWDAGVAD